MIIPVKCFTCGKVIANKWLAYKERVEKLQQENDKDSGLAENFDKNLKGKFSMNLVLIAYVVVDICFLTLT